MKSILRLNFCVESCVFSLKNHNIIYNALFHAYTLRLLRHHSFFFQENIHLMILILETAPFLANSSSSATLQDRRGLPNHEAALLLAILSGPRYPRPEPTALQHGLFPPSPSPPLSPPHLLSLTAPLSSTALHATP